MSDFLGRFVMIGFGSFITFAGCDMNSDSGVAIGVFIILMGIFCDPHENLLE